MFLLGSFHLLMSVFIIEVEWLGYYFIVNFNFLNIIYRWEQFKLECYL
jgi:hypothetical protein